MRLLALPLALAVLALSAAPAVSNVRLAYQGDAPTNPYEAWAAAMKVPQPDTQVTLNLDRDSWPHTNTVWMPDDIISTIVLGQYAPLQRWQFWHELGHVFDHTMMTDALRDMFQRVIGKSGQPWDDWQHQDSASNEQFAEAYRVCAQSYVLPQPKTVFNYGYAPTRPRHALACNIIRFAAFLHYRNQQT